jgi:hypothetical protein
MGLFIVIDGVAGAIFVPTSTQSFRVTHSYYHHGLAPSVDTVTKWGGNTYR